LKEALRLPRLYAFLPLSVILGIEIGFSFGSFPTLLELNMINITMAVSGVGSVLGGMTMVRMNRIVIGLCHIALCVGHCG
jgi:hypothetical protein